MNTLIPFNWLKEYCKTDVDLKTFIKRLSLVGNEIERTIRPDKYLARVLVGRVKEINPHPDADKLQLVTTEINGGKTVQIVCGGTNLEGGQLVAVALPGALVSWHGDNELTLEETKIRGQESFGMICAAEELGFPGLGGGTNIWDLSGVAKDSDVGRDLAEVLDLDDTVFDIEMTTNRPDGMAVVGQAREACAAALGDMDDPLKKVPKIPVHEGDDKYVFNLQVDEHDLCPRYMGVVMDVKVGPSPWWLQKRLILAGAKPINNVVDITNYVRLELGQPMHAFDYNKIDGGKIVVRSAKQGEKFLALNEEEYELSEGMLVIADESKPVAVGGVMGGLDSGVSGLTKTIILESATFDPLSIRETWRALNLQSDSQALYEKGLSTELAPHGMARAIELLRVLAHGQVVGKVQDDRKGDYVHRAFSLDPKKVNKLIGIEIDTNTQIGMLSRLGFEVSDTDQDGVYEVKVPFWRDMDIESDVDLTEEIARLYGYENLPSTIPSGVIPRRERDTLLDRENEIKDLLAGSGWTEVYANSFIDPEDAVRAGIDPALGLIVMNPLAQDQALMRPSLIPNMMRTIAENEQREGVERLFELQRVYLKREGDLPEERSMLLVAIVDEVGGEDLFRHMKGSLEIIMSKYHAEFELSREGLSSQWHPGRSARVLVDGEAVGTLGEVHPIVVQAFGVEYKVAMMEIDLPMLQKHMKLDPSYDEPTEFPAALRDLALLVDEKVAYRELTETMMDSSKLLKSIELFDLYRGSQIEKGKKSLAVHLTLADDHTLTSEEVDVDIKKITDELISTHGVVIRD
ncbi:phenylalanine--tRNA ligase subunit beta [Candidatus Uhrbacteria bacterium]|jgi:phenylalanyl-tRNA synthetase beta chain|nr:phenylalanine--tRNA ligase subunit beta [Candidatus Uhrbacteria bacterium]